MAAQEDCVKNCTSASGINACVGNTPHTDADWNALDTSTKNCYCKAVTDFSVCSPNCSTDGFTSDVYGRLFGQWRYVNQICGDVVDQFKSAASAGNNTATSTQTFSTIPVQLFHTETTAAPKKTLDPVPGPNSNPSTLTTSTGAPSSTDSPEPSTTSSHASSSKVRTIAISVSVVNFVLLVIGVSIWLLFRNRRKRLDQNGHGKENLRSAVIVIGPDGFPVDQSGPNLVSPMRGDFKSDTIKKWIQDQEKMKQKVESDTMTETLSVGYTLWSETDLCFTEMGAEDVRDMETIKEEPDGEDEIRSAHRIV